MAETIDQRIARLRAEYEALHEDAQTVLVDPQQHAARMQRLTELLDEIRKLEKMASGRD